MSKDMTPEEFIRLYRSDLYWSNQHKGMVSDLTSVIRGKLIEFVCKLRGCHPESKYGELLIQQIDRVLAENGLNNNQ